MNTNLQASSVQVNSPDAQHVKIPRRDLGFDIAGDLYLPIDFKADKSYAAIVVSHPGGGVKEQTAGTYARRLAEAGFVTVGFDASYQGASGGEPRSLDDPNIRVEDISYVIDYLETLPFIDESNIGALGICAGGGATMKASCLDRRIKATAGISIFDVGAASRSVGKDALIQNLDKIAAQKTAEAKGDTILLTPIIPDNKAELAANAPQFLIDAVDYYRTARGYHPRTTNRAVFSIQDRTVGFFPFELMGELMDRPLLIISGEKSDTIGFSQAAYNASNGPKELYLVKGAGHVDMYDKEPYVSEAVDKMADFFSQNLHKQS